MGDRIEFIGGHPGLHRRARCLNSPGGDSSSAPDSLNFFFGIHVVSEVFRWCLPTHIFRASDTARYTSGRSDNAGNQ